MIGILSLVLVFQLLAGVPAATAQQNCGLDTRIPFAGHQFPLDGNLVEEDLAFRDAFPDWSSAGLSQPVFLTFPPDGSNRLFIIERQGLVKSIPNQSDATGNDISTVLDIQARVDSNSTEEGLLGLAVDPDFAQNRFFYVHYTGSATDCTQFARCARIVRYEIDPQDPDSALIGSAHVILEIERPGSFEHHNGGMIAFGGDGFLYVSVGDQDQRQLSQDTSSLRGKLLRIDVDSGTEFNPGIPPDNPFGNAVWHYGLRNPWRFSFDRENPNDLWVADVGANAREEVNWLPGGTGGGLDFGWPDCEGTLPTTPTGCTPSQRKPDLEYSTGIAGRLAVIGGYVYRGPLVSLTGQYLFADLGGDVFTWDRVTRDPVTGLGVIEERLTPVGSIASLAEDEAGEVYTWDYFSTAVISKFVGSTPGAGDPFPMNLSDTGLFTDVMSLAPAPGLIEYAVESPLWSDGAAKLRWIALPGNEKIEFHANAPWAFPIGTAIVKHFELDQPGFSPRRLETRVMLRQTGRWIGLTYRWNAQGTDATLLFDGLQEDIPLAGGGSQTWNFPSPSDCLECHSAPTGRALGVRTEQLNGVFDYGAVSDNQLHAWNCIGLFDWDIGDPAVYPRWAPLEDVSESIARRARSYLASNCAICHQPGTASTNMNLRADLLLGNMNMISRPPIRGDLGLPSPMIVDPGDHANSILSLRMESTIISERMAKGTLVPDALATALVVSWINGTLFDSGSGSTRLDSDEDGVLDGVDNCPGISNPSQANADSDGLGDPCDPDQQPDLRTTTSLPAQMDNGEAFMLEALVFNDGVLAAQTSQVRFHLSIDAVLSDDDTPIGACFAPAIGGFDSDGCTQLASVPDVTLVPEGDYFWIACADGLEVVAEGNENNNCASTMVLIPEPALIAMHAAGLFMVAGVVLWRRSEGSAMTA